MPSASANASTIDQLRRQLVQTQVETSDRAVFSTGFAGLDALLPESGLVSGSVVEWMSNTPGERAASIALKCSIGLLKNPGAFAVVDSDNSFHAASISHLGIPLERLLLIRPNAEQYRRSGEERRAETLWALEQLARCSGVCVVFAWIDRLSSTAQRRLQLAVEKSGVTVMLFRPGISAKQTSWSDLRFQVSASRFAPNSDDPGTLDSEICVRLLKCRHAVQSTGHVMLKVSDETGDVSEISELAGSAQTTPAAR